MLQDVDSIARAECELRTDGLVVIGVSGGPDSLCLLDVLNRAGYRLFVCHFNHQLRPEADQEAHDVEALAAAMSIPYAVECTDVREYARLRRLSIEEASRHLRYTFLFAQARRNQAQAVAVGHTADDQAETVLMHFLRGAGLNGLRGMSYRSRLPAFDAQIPLVRPLLDVWHEQTVAYCASRGLTPHYDLSNASLDFLRNRLRHQLMPALSEYNPRIRATLARNAKALAADYEVLAGALRVHWSDVLFRTGLEYVAFDSARLSGLSATLQRHLIRLAAEHIAPGQEVGYAALQRAAAFISGPPRKRVDLGGGLNLLREAGLLYVAASGAQLPSDAWPQIPSPLDALPVAVPGRTSLGGGWEFESRRQPLEASAYDRLSHSDDPFSVWLDAETVPDRLELRVRRPGDRFEPLGLGGHSQKLSDFFVNEKLPARARARWPLLCAGKTVIWVPGYRPAEVFKLRPGARAALRFSLHPPSGGK